MKPEQREKDLIARVEGLLAEQPGDENALRDALDELFSVYRHQKDQIERLIRISDRFQQMLQEKQSTIEELYRKSHRRQEKVSRISDLYQQIIQESHASLSEAATHDPLTGLPNRRLIHQRLNEEIERARRGGPEFCLAMLDIDHFKPINDSHGHEAGDRILVAVSRCIEQQMREYDLCGRWGGEEFLLLLADTRLETGRMIIDRVLAKVADLRVSAREVDMSVTISAGLTEHHPPETMHETIHRADQALYMSKQAGRNCTRTIP